MGQTQHEQSDGERDVDRQPAVEQVMKPLLFPRSRALFTERSQGFERPVDIGRPREGGETRQLGLQHPGVASGDLRK